MSQPVIWCTPMRANSVRTVTPRSTSRRDLLRTAGDSVGFDLDSHPFHAWAFGSRGTSLLTSDELPTAGSPAPLCAPPQPPHVPVITPHDGARKDLPPRLENKPLPPL